MRARLVPPFLVLAAAFSAGTAQAQGPEPNPESIEIGLSTDRVSITPNFAGTNLTIFGALDNADPTISRQGGYDVVVVLEGPPQATVVRKKTRVLGMWINTHSETFLKVPTSYAEATTRMPQDIADPELYRRLSLGAEYVRIETEGASDTPATLGEFHDALIQEKTDAGLYTMRVGGVQFLSQNLFRATLSLAPNVPVGTHRARAFLFRNGVFIKESSAPLAIRKGGSEQRIYEAAHDHSLPYGLAAVFIAAVTGWLGRVFFRKD